MPRLLIDQAAEVHSRPPSALEYPVPNASNPHVHYFGNLIYACEFAVSLAKAGHLNIAVNLESGDCLN
jgi:hypothetical protein